jgi:serine protease Do
MSRTRFALTAAAAAIAIASISGSAEARELTPREIYKTFSKAVVLIFATDGSAQGSAGTGSIISKDGEVITNAHVVSKEGTPYKKVFIYLKPDTLVGSMKDDLKQRFKATIVDLDPTLDLALLKMEEPPADLMTMAFGDPNSVEIGEPVVAIGHPETGGLWTLTTGAISAVVKDFQGVDGKDVFQTEASVNRGNSGGPLINAYGQMVGINTCISRRASDGLAITSINFSLKSSVPVEWMKRRKLMNLAYAKPEATASLAAADTKPPPASEPQVVAKVDAGDGKTKVAIAEPKKGEEVADDPSFNQQQGSGNNVSGSMSMPQKAKPTKIAAKIEPKQLTKARPYQIDGFVSDRVKEIRALEDLMKDAEQDIQRRSGKKQKVDTSDKFNF